MTHILIAEDEQRISEFIEKGLRAQGFTVSTAADGHAALALATHGQIDLLILDIGLPGIDGFTVLERLRRSGSTVPVLILTARDSVTDRVAGLEGGADDYMAKPFSFAELLARVRLRLASRPASARQESERLSVGDIRLDLRYRTASVDGNTLELSQREFALLEAFVRAPNQVLTRAVLLDQVWGYNHDPGSNVVDVYIGYLRQKLGPHRIQTVRGVGYRLLGP
jgi:DNA-binding response OmpR family regulator